MSFRGSVGISHFAATRSGCYCFLWCDDVTFCHLSGQTVVDWDFLWDFFQIICTSMSPSCPDVEDSTDVLQGVGEGGYCRLVIVSDWGSMCTVNGSRSFNLYYRQCPWAQVAGGVKYITLHICEKSMVIASVALCRSALHYCVWKLWSCYLHLCLHVISLPEHSVVLFVDGCSVEFLTSFWQWGKTCEFLLVLCGSVCFECMR